MIVERDGREADQARAVLQAAIGREPSDRAAGPRDGRKDRCLAGGDGVDAGDGRSENQATRR